MAFQETHVTEASSRYVCPEEPFFMCFVCYKRFKSGKILTHHMIICGGDASKPESESNLLEQCLTDDHAGAGRFLRSPSCQMFKSQPQDQKTHYRSKLLQDALDEVFKRKTVQNNRTDGITSGNISIKVSTPTDFIFPTNVELFQCDKCGEQFKSKRSISYHLANHHHSDNRPSKFDTAFQSESRPQEHSTLHRNNDMSFKCNNSECDGEAFTSARSCIENHLSEVHINETRLICDKPECGKVFTTKSNLTRHLRYVHSDKGPLMCVEPKCGKVFKKRGVLNQHLHEVHSNERPFICNRPKCGKTFKSRGKLTEHLLHFHSNERRFICNRPKCGKTFKSRGNLTEHLLEVHCDERHFKCDRPRCSKAFKSKYNLNCHLITVHKK